MRIQTLENVLYELEVTEDLSKVNDHVIKTRGLQLAAYVTHLIDTGTSVERCLRAKQYLDEKEKRGFLNDYVSVHKNLVRALKQFRKMNSEIRNRKFFDDKLLYGITAHFISMINKAKEAVRIYYTEELFKDVRDELESLLKEYDSLL